MTWKDPTTGKKVKRTTGTTSKNLARAVAAKQHERLVRRANGLPPAPDDVQCAQPLAKLLDAYEKSIDSKKRNSSCARQTIVRVRRVIAECGWQVVSDISVHPLELALGRLKDERSKKPLSSNTRNDHLVSLRTFINWLVPEHLAVNPLVKMKKLNPEKDRKRIRRPLSVPEFERLVLAAKSGPTVAGMPGKQRAIAYVLAVYSGFRRRSLQSLRVQDFNLDAGTVVLPAAATKNAKVTPPTPLPATLVEAIRKVVVGLQPNDRPFEQLTKHASANGFKADAAAAGIAIKDDCQRICDLHSCRMTFACWLRDAGVSLVDSQRLMHHSTPVLTANIYTTTSTEAARAAVAKLPAPPSLD